MIKADSSHKVIHYKKITSDHCPSFSGIAAGECKGELWVDHLENANIAIANSYAVGGFAFLGEITSEEQYKEVERFIHEELFAWLKSKGINYFEFSIENDNLRSRVLKMFGDRNIKKEQEFSFRKKDGIPELLSLPAEYTIQQIDEKFWNLIDEGKVGNGAFVTKRILGSWESFDDFCEKSLAYCMTYLNQIVAVIAGTAKFNDVIAIDIETKEAHRNRGLALIMTEKFVNECVRRGMTAQWDCVESNLASRKLAEKAGFTFVRENEVYGFDL
ncbi:GNAT family N-acetyltransferase [Paenibacillus sp. NPDC058174]|uniref:GNAT family N-acetyltransferase n=1 Tax=Paenibacillus sp. NPDC058174 TaxID=3346366 RepID=UPI0036DA2096